MGLRSLAPSLCIVVGFAGCTPVPPDMVQPADLPPGVVPPGDPIEVFAPPDGPESLALTAWKVPPPGGPCYSVGESDLTREYLDDGAELFACPPGTELAALGDFADATPVAIQEGWSLYSRPYDF